MIPLYHLQRSRKGREEWRMSAMRRSEAAGSRTAGCETATDSQAAEDTDDTTAADATEA
jgi:hypothetical protein